MISRTVSTILFLYLVASAPAAPVGTIKGYIKDPSGGAVANADLLLIDEKTGVQTRTVSDSNGLYQFLNLNPSVYAIVTQADGFSRTEAAHITVLVGQIVSADLNLSVPL